MSRGRLGLQGWLLALASGAASLGAVMLPWRWRPSAALGLRTAVYTVQQWIPRFNALYKGVTSQQESALRGPEPAEETDTAEPIPEGDEVALLFSGGVDSTLAALLLAEKFDKVRLCTFRTGYMHDIQGATRHLPRLRARFGDDKFEHEFLCGEAVEAIVKEIYLSRFWRDLRRWGLFKANFCGACKVAFTIAITKYCLERGIRYVASGANREFGAGEFFIGQMPSTIPVFQRFFARYGIAMLSPVYHLQRNDKRLHEMGFLDDWQGAKVGSLTEGARTVSGLRDRGQIACDQDVISSLYIQGYGVPVLGADEFRARSVEYTQALLDEFGPKWLEPAGAREAASQ